MKKRGFSVEKFSSGFIQQKFALPENFLRKKIFLFRETFIFLLSFLELEWFLRLFADFFCQVCQTTNQRVERKKMAKLFFEKLISLTNFWLWAEKTWTFSKTVRHDSQNRSLQEQMNNFRKFYGSKKICLKVSGHWTETSDFRRKYFLSIVKSAF